MCRIHQRTQKTAFTLVETVLTVTLTAMLLAAIAVAVKTSLSSYQNNEKVAAVTQGARSALNQMMRDIRAAEAVEALPARLTIVPPADVSGLQQIQYEFLGDGKLYYRRTVSGVTTSYVLLGDDVSVSTFYVTSKMAEDGEGILYTKGVTVRLELVVDNQTMVVTASASPRRNQEY